MTRYLNSAHLLAAAAAAGMYGVRPMSEEDERIALEEEAIKQYQEMTEKAAIEREAEINAAKPKTRQQRRAEERQSAKAQHRGNTKAKKHEHAYYGGQPIVTTRNERRGR